MADAVVYIGPQPRCPVHGRMHYDFMFDWWMCPGYDGEGCSYRVTAEEFYRDMTPIGTTDPDAFCYRTASGHTVHGPACRCEDPP